MGDLSIEDLSLQLKAFEYASRFPDFPKNFTPPALLDPHYVPPYRGAPVVAVIIVTLVLAILIVAARILARMTVDEEGLWWDDYLVIGGLCFTIGLSGIQLGLYLVGGLGRHAFDTPLSSAFPAYKMGFAEVVVYMVACFLIKLSVGFFLCRTVAKASDRWRLAIYISMVLVCLPYILGLLLWIFACKPIAAGWDFKLRLTQEYSCINPATFTRGITIVFAAGDIWLLTMPIIIIWGTQMATRTRIALTFVFATGGVACVAIVARIVVVDSLYQSFDASWNCFWVSIWTQLEVTLGIICASVPPLQVLLMHVVDRHKRSRLMRRGIQTLNIFRPTTEVDELQAVEAARSKLSYLHRRMSSDDCHLIKQPNMDETANNLEKPEPLWAPRSAAYVFKNVSIEQSASQLGGSEKKLQRI